jgi:uncharacterized damage-inducible protein DinB
MQLVTSNLQLFYSLIISDLNFKPNVIIFDDIMTGAAIDFTHLKPYKYNGARSLVLLHEKHLKSFLSVWKTAKKLNVALPKTDDQDYQSLQTLLRHIFRSARGYMIWMCDKLDLDDPDIDKTPDADEISLQADTYISHLLEKWRLPLSEIPEERFHSPVYKSRWGVDYCIDAMLEHAVMHTIRHEFQLTNLIIKSESRNENF